MTPQTLGIDPYIGVLIMGIFSAGFLITMLLLASYLGPKNKTHTKQLPFECGTVSTGSVHDSRFNVRFYLVCLLFILFDIEVIFMYPWAISLRELGWTGYGHMLFFMIVLAIGLVYEWRKGVLDWNK